MNRYETPQESQEKHPAVKMMESILSKDNPKSAELRNVIQNAESYSDIKHYISKEKFIYGADGRKFSAQDVNPWIDMLRKQFPDLEQLRQTQAYQEILGDSTAPTESEKTEVIDRSWIDDSVEHEEIVSDANTNKGTETVDIYPSAQDANLTQIRDGRNKVSAEGVLNNSRNGRRSGSAESALNK